MENTNNINCHECGAEIPDKLSYFLKGNRVCDKCAKVIANELMGVKEVQEGPDELTENNVCFWSRHAREFKGSITNKAKLLLKHNCIHYIGDDATFKSKYTFICLPLDEQDFFEYKERNFIKKPFVRDYNSSEYLMYKTDDKRWICNCQGWRTAEKNAEKKRVDGVQCSHLVALFLCFKLKRFNQKHGAEDKDMEVDMYEEE